MRDPFASWSTVYPGSQVRTLLQLFTGGSAGEDWRLFREADAPHFVVGGGRIEDPE